MKKPHGFALLTPERRRELASRGGKAVPPEKRSFSYDKQLASQCGKLGGLKSTNRTFCDPDKAREAGRKGGRASRVKLDAPSGS